MKQYINQLKNWWKKQDKQRFLYFKVAPAILALGFAFLLGLLTNLGASGGTNGSNKQTQTITSSISKSVDFPTQAKEIQSKELLVLKSQLEAYSGGSSSTNSSSNSSSANSTKTNNNIRDTDFQSMLTTLNENNDLDSFFATLLSLNYKESAANQYKSLEDYLAKDNYSDDSNTNTVEANIYGFLKGNSYAKETKSRTAKVGTVWSALMSGSNNKTRYYTVLVPASSGKNTQANLIYFVQLTQTGKVVDVSYGGQLNNKDVAGSYKDLAQVFAKVSTGDNK
ncbi:TPA: hypothetical protein ACGWER_001729 [Streptococcus agalactiae]|nr:hypothetical protein [Streptococcus agalactiae]HEO2267378.1 hypothetical protein [Streptococcus agalactiae]HEO7770448.1 hypothetical protein [Streptococcus agalactiae]